MDWTESIERVHKPTSSWHFQFKICKRHYLKRINSTGTISIRGEVHYRNDTGSYGNITKKEKKTRMINPKIIKAGKEVNILKLNDVKKLLTKHYGPTWRNLGILKYYNKLIPQTNSFSNEEIEPDDNNIAEEDTIYCSFIPEIEELVV